MKKISIISILLLNIAISFSQTISYKYDNLYRLIQVDYPNDTSVVYTYDELGNRTRKITTTIVHVENIILNESSVQLERNQTFQLVATISPTDATNKNVSWKSSDPDIVNVSSTGMITAMTVGGATITVTTVDGNKTASCMVTVASDETIFCDDLIDSGKTGDLDWVLCSDGTLTISGEGKMGDYIHDQGPWANRNDIQSVIIQHGVTSIGRCAFYHSSIVTIDIPNSVTSIGECAFTGCDELSSVFLPGSVTSIGFGNDAGFLLNGLSGFYSCPGLLEINVSDDNPRFSSLDGVLYDKEKASLIKYPDAKAGAFIVPGSVTSIGDRAFLSCYGLSAITFPKNLTTIEGRAFSNCDNLTTIYNLNPVPQIIGDAAFTIAKINNITLYVPACNISAYQNTEIWKDFGTIIGEDSYSCELVEPGKPIYFISDERSGTIGEWSWLEALEIETNKCTNQVIWESTNPDIVSVEALSVSWSSCEKACKISYIREGTAIITATTLDGNYLASCEVTVTSDGTINCDNPIDSGKTGDLDWVLCPDGTLTISGEGAMADYSNDEAPWYDKGSDILFIKIQHGVTSIGSYAFYYSNVVTVDIPNTVTSIGENAFTGCEKLTSVFLPSSVTSIGFVNDVGFFFSGFYYCPGLLEINVSDENPQFSSLDGVLYDKEKTTLIKYPDAKTGTFIVPGSVTKIRYSAFEHCHGLSTITFSQNLTDIERKAFYICENLTTIYNLNPVPQNIGYNAFSIDDIKKAVLYVPFCSISAYQNAEIWKDFGTIIGDESYPCIIDVRDIKLDKPTLELYVNETAQLIAIITPVNATDKTVRWDSNNLAAATVSSDGTVTAIAPGIADITVTASDGGITAVCKVTVTTKETTSVSENTVPANSLRAYPTVVLIGQNITVESDASNEALKGAVITIYNLAGAKISEHSVQGNITRMSAPNTPGLFLLHLTSRDGTPLGITKIVVE